MRVVLDGQVRELPDHYALRLIEQGMAEPVSDAASAPRGKAEGKKRKKRRKA